MLWKVGRIIVERNDVLGDIECLCMLLEIVTNHLNHEIQTTETALINYKQSLGKDCTKEQKENYDNVSFYRYGSIDSLKWTVVQIERELLEIGTGMNDKDILEIEKKMENRETWLDQYMLKGKTRTLLGRLKEIDERPSKKQKTN